MLPVQLGCMGFPVVSAAVMSAISPSLFLGEFIFFVFLNGFACISLMTMEYKHILLVHAVTIAFKSVYARFFIFLTRG